MVKEDKIEKDNNNNNNNNSKKMFVGIVWNCAAELKLLLTALLFLCSLATVFQFLPSHLPFSVSDLCYCVSTTTTTAAASANLSVSDSAPLLNSPPVEKDQVLSDGIMKRSFNPYGSAAYNFILMSAYRGSAATFAVMGLSSKPLHVFGKPTYQCEWVPNPTAGEILEPITVAGQKILPDWGYDQVYTVVVVNCTFPIPAGGLSGGKLLIHACAGDQNFNLTDTIKGIWGILGILTQI